MRSTSKIPLAQLSINASPPTPSPTAMRSLGDSSPARSYSCTVLLNNAGGSRRVQNPSQSSPVTGTLSRVLRSLEFPGPEMDDYSDEEGDEESE